MKMLSDRKKISFGKLFFICTFGCWWGLVLHAFPVALSNAPSDNLDLALKTVRSARSHLLVNAYELYSPEIAAAISERAKNGVRVWILVEDEPYSGIKPDTLTVRNYLLKAMQDKGANPSNQFSLMSGKNNNGKRRFKFNHAKYMVVDGRYLLIGSENYTPTGHPKRGTSGNRGWEVLVANIQVASWFQQLFTKDADTKYGDVVQMIGRAPFFWAARYILDSSFYSGLLPEGLEQEDNPQWQVKNPTVEVSNLDIITAPTYSTKGLLKLFEEARQTLDLELMSFSPAWGAPGTRSILLDGVLKAAKRGVAVRVLLNDESVFDEPGKPPKKSSNQTMVYLLTKIAKEAGLKIQARIANIKKMRITYIHNKGILVDGNKVLISSINFTQNSVENNRETAVLLHSGKAVSYYQHLFERDWKASE